MHIDISSQNVELETKEIAHIEAKINKLKRYFPSTDTSTNASIVVIKTTNHHNKGDIYKAEIRLHSAGKEYYSEATTSDVRKAVDKAFQTMESEIKSVSGKQNALFKRGAKKIKEILRFQK